MGEGRLIKIGELAKKAGTSLRTIRYYEELGLINHTVRTKGGFRLYPEEELQKVKLIKDLQLLDFSLSRIREILEKRRGARTGAEMAPSLQALLIQQLEEIEARLTRYQMMQKAVQETLEILQCCTVCNLSPGKEVCWSCPAVRNREEVPLPMQVLISA